MNARIHRLPFVNIYLNSLNSINSSKVTFPLNSSYFAFKYPMRLSERPSVP